METRASSIPILWTRREPPLAPIAVAARGAFAISLAERLLAFTDDQLAALRGVSARELLLVSGRRESLPWVDGAEYLGADERAPSLWMPTTRAPSVHPQLLERALFREYELDHHARPVALLLDPPAVAPFGRALPIARSELAAWLKDQAAP